MPGLIQPHGAMLVLRDDDLVILKASENTQALFGIAAALLATRRLSDLLGPAQAASVEAAIGAAQERLAGGPLPLLQQVRSPSRGDLFDVIAHRAGGTVILEFEAAAAPSPRPRDLYGDLAACIDRLHTANGLQPFLDLAVAQVRDFTGFDRVMVYEFAPDGSGHVVAESRADDLESYLGLHFPAADIPAPARRLFALSGLRHLPDVDYRPVRLLPETADPVDMSRSILRHVSLMHSSYLKTMRVRSTMVLPLMKAGHLWGLLSCMHHAAPLHVPFATRSAVEVLAHMVSLLMMEQVERVLAAYRARMADAIMRLGQQISQPQPPYPGLADWESNGWPLTLCGWLDAAGAALVLEDGIVLFGETPGRPAVRAIAAWLGGRDDGMSVFVTDRLPDLCPVAATLRDSACGLLAARLTRTRAAFVMWFRPEVFHTIDWAGDPHKPVQRDVVDGEAGLTPRGSFERWKQTVLGTSRPWQPCEAEAAASLRQVLAEAMLVRMNDDLLHSNAELDSFAHVASHDLKEPLRGISNFANFFLRSAKAKLTEEERGRIETILRLTRRMDDLTDALLHYSRVSRADLALQSVDLNSMVSDVIEASHSRLEETGTVVRVPRPLPTVRADRVRLTEVFSNLLVNAIKYNDRPAGERWVEIGWTAVDGRPLFSVRDNGIGISGKNLEAVFQIFRRLHGRDDYDGGSGAGLTIARRTVERHGGRLWVESAGPGHGSTFLFTLGGDADGAGSAARIVSAREHARTVETFDA